MNKKLEQLQEKADNEGWTLQVLRHPDQDVMDTYDLGQDIMNSPAMNRIASKKQLEAGPLDRGISAVSSTYAKVQSVVTPGARTANRQLTIVEDMYRTLSGSAHTVTQASVVNPLNRQVGVTAEGYASQLHKQSEQLTANLIRIHRQARRDAKGTGINYDGGFVPASLTKGQVQFEEAVSDYIRRKHASEMGYDVEVPTDVHPSIKEAATESERYFTMMGDELVKSGILDADNRLLGRYLPVVFDHRAVRKNQAAFVDDLVKAFEEKDVQGLLRGLDDLEVDEALVREMNVRAGRDLFADEAAAPDPPRVEPEPEPTPPARDPIDVRAREELDDINRQLEEDPDGRPMNMPEESAAPDRSWDDFDSGGFAGPVLKGRLGDETSVFLPDGKAMMARWALVDAMDVIPSHSAIRGLNARGGFPQNRNADNNLGRGYSDPKLGAAPIALVKKIGSNPNIDLLVNTSVDAMNGPSIVTKHGQVLGGNARMMGTQVIYDKGGKNAAEFRKKTIDLAQTLGIADTDGPKNPVLVRVAYEPGARGQLSEILNRPASTGYTALGDAIAKGSKLTIGRSAAEGGAPRTTSLLVDMGVGESTVRSSLANPAKSEELANALLTEGVWTQAEYNSLYRPDARKFTDAGKRNVEQIIAARLLGDESVLADAPDSLMRKVEQAGPRLLALANDEVGSPYFISKLQEATDLLPRWKDSGLTFDDFFLNQATMTGRTAAMKDPVVLALVKSLDETTSKEFGQRVTRYYDAIDADSRMNPDQARMFDPEVSGTTGDAFFEVWGDMESPAIAKAREARGNVGQLDLARERLIKNKFQADDLESSWARRTEILEYAGTARPAMRAMMDDLIEHAPGVVNLKSLDELDSQGNPLAGLTGPRVKSLKQDSAGRSRVRDKMESQNDLMHEMSDLLAGRLVVDDLEPETLGQLYRYIEDSGYRIIDGRPEDPIMPYGVREFPDGYHAAHIQVEVADGLTAELQFHTVERFKVLEEAHVYYDRARSPDFDPANDLDGVVAAGKKLHEQAGKDYRARLYGDSSSMRSPNSSLPANRSAVRGATLEGQVISPTPGPVSPSLSGSQRARIGLQRSRVPSTTRQSPESSLAMGDRSVIDETSISSIDDTGLTVNLKVGDLNPSLRQAYLERLDAQRRQAAEAIRDGILNPQTGTGVAMGVSVPPALRQRTLGINYASMGKFLDSQMTRTVMRYDQQVAGNIGVRRSLQTNPETWEKYRTPSGKRVRTPEDLEAVLDQEFDTLRRVADLAGDEKLSAKIEDLHRKSRRDLMMPMQAMLGRNPVKGAIDPDDFLSFFGRSVQRYNFVNKLGSVGWAQLNDFAPVTLHLLQNPKSLAAIPRALTSLKDFPKRDLEILGLWSDNLGRTRAITDMDYDALDNGFGTGKTRAISGALDVGLTKMADIGGHLSGMNWITNANKRLAGMLTFDRMGNTSKKMLRAQALQRQGMSLDESFRKVRLTKYMAAKVNQLGMDVRAAQRYHRLVYAHGTDLKGRRIKDLMSYDKYLKNEKGVFLPGFEDWADSPRNTMLLDTIRSRVDDEVNRHIVVTPGYFDRPLINFNTWGKLFNQFQTFMMAFQHQRLLPMTQMPAKHQAWYLTSYMAIGAITDTITNALSGRRSIEDSVQQWQENPAGMAYKAFVYSGLSGPVNRIWGLTDALGIPGSPGVLLDNRVGGGASQGFYYGDPGAKTLIQALGPTASTASRIGDVTGDVLGPGEVDRRTAYRAATLLPYQNNAILRMLYRGTGLPVAPEALKE